MPYPEDYTPTSHKTTREVHEAVRAEFLDRCCPHCGRAPADTVPRLALKWKRVPRTVRKIVRPVREKAGM